MNFKISKLRNFKNIEGSYAFVNPEISTEFNGITVFDVKFNELKPVMMLTLNKQIEDFLEQLKSSVIDEVYHRRIYNCSKEELHGYFVNPIKTVKQGKKLTESVKLKITDPDIKKLSKKTNVKCDIVISSLWFNETSFGVYLNANKITIPEKKCLIVDSDCESEINLKI
jgi:hypothetical protein